MYVWGAVRRRQLALRVPEWNNPATEINAESDCGLEVVARGLSAVQLTAACFGCSNSYGLGVGRKASGGSR